MRASSLRAGLLPLVLLFTVAPVFAAEVKAPAAKPAAKTDWVGRFARMSIEDRAALLTRASTLPLSERLLEISEAFLDTPYALSPLGEGEGIDADPRFRWDAVDCLTMVEQVMALALSPADGSAPERAVLPVLDRIRYGTSVSYSERNHLMEADWLPSNAQKGFLKVVTRALGGDAVTRLEKVLTKQTWTSVSSKSLALPPERQQVGRYPLDVLPLEEVFPRIRSIPSGTLLLVVREDRPLKATRITHLGFVVQKRRRAYFRHAARNHHGRVIDEDLETFLTRNSKYTKWPVTGVMLVEVTEPPVNVALPDAP